MTLPPADPDVMRIGAKWKQFGKCWYLRLLPQSIRPVLLLFETMHKCPDHICGLGCHRNELHLSVKFSQRIHLGDHHHTGRAPGGPEVQYEHLPAEVGNVRCICPVIIDRGKSDQSRYLVAFNGVSPGPCA